MRRVLVLVAALAMAQPLVAQSSNCAGEWIRLMDALGRAFGWVPPAPGLFRQTADRGCRTDGLVFRVNEHVALKADRLTWSGRDMARFATEGLPPTALDLKLSGIRVVPQLGDKAFQYLQDIQARGQKTDITLSVHWDAARNVVSLDNLLISFPDDDFIRVTGEIEGVDLTSAASLRSSAASFGLTKLDIDIRSERFFQNYILLPFGMVVLDGHDDPQARMREVIAMGKEAVAHAPSGLVSSGTKAALTALLDDMPDPAGRLKISQRASPGIGVARGLAFGMRARSVKTVEDLLPLFDGVEVDITYEPL